MPPWQEETSQITCESLSHAFSQIVDHKRPSLWTLIDALRKNWSLVSVALLQEERGQPPKERVERCTKQFQERLFERRDGRKTVTQTLTVVGYCIRL